VNKQTEQIIAKASEIIDRVIKTMLERNGFAISDLKNYDEADRLQKIIDNTKKAWEEKKKYSKVLDEEAKAEAERLKSKSGVVTGKGSAESIAEGDVGKIDTSKVDDAVKKSDEQWTKLTRARELSQLEADRKALREIMYFWDDALEVDKAGGARHIDELNVMREKAIADFLRVDFETALPTFQGRGLATGYEPSTGLKQEGSTGGEVASEASKKAAEKAEQEMASRRAVAEAIREETISAGKSELEIENETYNKKLELLNEFNLSSEELTKQHNEKLELLDMARLESAADLAGGLAALSNATAGENKQMLMAYKVLASAQAGMDTYAAANKAFLTGGGWPWGAVGAAASISYGLANVARINEIHFQQGTKSPDASFGVIPGTSYYGDKVPIMANSGETLLSRSESRDYRSGNAEPMIINYSPTYNAEVSVLQKRNDYREFRRTMKSVMQNRSFERSQASTM